MSQIKEKSPIDKRTVRLEPKKPEITLDDEIDILLKLQKSDSVTIGEDKLVRNLREMANRYQSNFDPEKTPEINSPMHKNYTNNNLLHLACMKGNLEDIRQLLSWNADVNTTNSNRMTALEVACISCHAPDREERKTEITSLLNSKLREERKTEVTSLLNLKIEKELKDRVPSPIISTSTSVPSSNSIFRRLFGSTNEPKR